jgi:hypothetical protein
MLPVVIWESAMSLRDSIQGASEATHTTASVVSGLTTVAGAIVGVVATIFFAGVYYKEISQTITDYKERVANLEDEVATLNTQIEKLEGDSKTLGDKIEKVRNASGRVTVNGTDSSVADGTGAVGSMGGTLNLDNEEFVQCPAGSFVSAIQGLTKNASGGEIMQIRYACRSVD